MEAWLASIEPRVIDAWLAYCKVEPEAFGGGGGQRPAERKEWMAPDQAQGYFARISKR